MQYSKKVKERVLNAPRTMGTQLWMWAIERQFSVQQIAECTGASRQSVYNWLKGKSIQMRYQARVKALIKILHDNETAEAAWGQACKEFNLETSRTAS